MSTWTTAFSDPACTDPSVAGGKGANLARTAAAGLPVPPGFCVTTEAYAQFVREAGLADRITATIAAAGGTADEVEAATAALREAMVAAPMPDPLADAIVAAYWKLGASDPSRADSGSASYVAVRSSGTAEDLAGASFAGLHDTYLDIRGIDAVLDAVKRCWASMWTARATSYRATRGFDQDAARIAVVVQTMVSADVAGVMFTANPLSGATDEIVVNASWGLGEALVSGIATPDEHILALPDLRVKDQRIGAKERRVVRDPSAVSGTLTEDTPAPDRERFALSGEQLHALGEMGRHVMAHYGGIPQDIEWALAGNHLYLLQSRPATGTDFSWDEDLEVWRTDPDDVDIVWTSSWADAVWTGGISPFVYSYRGEVFHRAMADSMKLWGLKRPGQPLFRYHRGHVYYNSDLEQRVVQETALPAFRVGPALDHIAPDQVEAAKAAKLSLPRYLWIYTRITLKGRPVHGVQNYFRTVDDYLNNRVAEADGLTAAQLTELDDQALIGHIQGIVDLKTKNTTDQWTEFFVIARDAVGLLVGLIARWYDPDPMPTFTDLMTGSPERTTTAEENLWLWRLSERIRASPQLRAEFERAGAGYLQAFEGSNEGRGFLADYAAFMAAHGHRGHADRDVYYPRRADDPSIDHQNFATLLAVTNPVDPVQRENEVNARREAVLEAVARKVGKGPAGGLKMKLLRGVLDYCHRFFRYRDNQRHHFDRYTYSMRRSAVELGNRLVARGRIAEVEDVYFLGRSEAFALLLGEPATELTRAKIAGRRANFSRMVEREARLPKYLRDGASVVYDGDAGEGGLVGVGTSRGIVTGTARVIPRLKDMGQVKEGDILVTNSTDPGWTPVFTLLSGIVLETGGMLAHGSLLAREYGFPAVQIPDATRLIPDGATITVNGDTGEVVLLSGSTGSTDSTDDESEDERVTL